MKYFNKKHRDIFLKQLKEDLARVEDERYVLKYLPLAFKYARATNVEESKVGVLNLQDIEQAAIEGLCDIWRSIDWDIIEDKPNGEKALINYLSARITRTIKRQIYKDATGVSIPEYIITKTKKELIADSLFGNWMFSFRVEEQNSKTDKMISYIDSVEWRPDPQFAWDNEELNDRLTTAMQGLRQKERDIIMWSFGIYEKLSIKEISKRLKMSEIGVKKAKAIAISKLKTEENEILFKDFL